MSPEEDKQFHERLIPLCKGEKKPNGKSQKSGHDCPGLANVTQIKIRWSLYYTIYGVISESRIRR